MNFDYIRVLDFPKHQKRERILPWIRFGIFNLENESNILYPLGLIDSGSDITIIDYEFGEALDIDIKKGIKGEVVGVGGGIIKVYFHQIGFSIHDGSKESPIKYDSIVAFGYSRFPKTMPQQTAILGTLGFFDHVDVKLMYPEKILIEPKIIKAFGD
jgi:hypothetical protein